MTRPKTRAVRQSPWREQELLWGLPRWNQQMVARSQVRMTAEAGLENGPPILSRFHLNQ